MTTLPETARLAGYTVISNNAPTALEVDGPGEWAILELACRRFVYRGIRGQCVDHVTVVVRSADGTRELRDVGVNGVRRAELPPVAHKEPRQVRPCTWIPKKDYATETPGVFARGNRFRVRAYSHYVGTFSIYIEAVDARMMALKKVVAA